MLSLLAGIDRVTAGHSAIALRLYRERLVATGRDVPAGFDDLHKFLVDMSGQCPPFRLVSGDDGSANRYLLAVADAAAVVGVSTKTLRRRIAEGRLPAVKVGRRVLLTPEAVTEFIEQHTKVA